MKKLLFSLLTLFFFSVAVNAQTKASETVKIYTPSVQCDMCKNRIEQYLKRIDGVTFVNVGVKNKITTVKFLNDRTNLEMVKTSIANAGYDVAKPTDDKKAEPEIEIAANPDSYNLLPKCCKKPATGSEKQKQ
jgi:periplasmic mercuric ion binding protein